MSERAYPDFGALLAPHLEKIDDAARPLFLAALERGAADRYRRWAGEIESLSAGLLECAAREDEIATRVERLFPVDAEARQRVAAEMPGARDTYLAVFEDMAVEEQLLVQANAERQGAAAWRGIASQQRDPSVREALEACARLEEESALFLEDALV